MKTRQMHNLQRVHVRILVRLQQLYEEISASHFPSSQDLAPRVERHPRPILRDLKPYERILMRRSPMTRSEKAIGKLTQDGTCH